MQELQLIHGPRSTSLCTSWVRLTTAWHQWRMLVMLVLEVCSREG